MGKTSGRPQGPMPARLKPKSPRPTSKPIPPDLLTITIQTKTAQIVKIESADGSGIHELTEEDKAHLRKEIGKYTLEELIEEAFEAGIACGLGEMPELGDTEESEQEADARHILLADLIKNCSAQRLMQSGVLCRAILGTLVGRGIALGATQELPSKPAGESRHGRRPPGRRQSSANVPHRGG